MSAPHPILPALALAGLLGLGACATDGTGTAQAPVAAPAAPATAPANARGPGGQTGGTLANRLQFRTEVQEPAGFVREGRPANLDYIPVGVTPQRTGVQRSAAELQAIEKELDAQRQRSRAFANRPKPASTYDGTPAPRLRPAARPPGE